MNNLLKRGLGFALSLAMVVPTIVMPTTTMAADDEVIITYNSLDDLTNAGVTLEDMEIYSEQQILDQNVNSLHWPQQEDGTVYNDGFYIRRTSKGKGAVIIELPEEKSLETFWWESVRKSEGKFDVYASETLDGTYDKLNYTGVVGTQFDTTEFKWLPQTDANGTIAGGRWFMYAWNSTRYAYEPTSDDKQYRYVKITGDYDVLDKLQGVGVTDIAIGKMGYTVKAASPVVAGDVEIKWTTGSKCKSELEKQGVTLVTESGSVALKTEQYLLHNNDTKAEDTEYNSYGLKLEGEGTGHLLIKAPEGAVFTKFWVDCIRRANEWHKVYISEDGETWSDALTAESKTDINIYREEKHDLGQNKKHTYNIAAEKTTGKFKYIKFKFRDDGGNDSWYQAIGKMGYTLMAEEDVPTEPVNPNPGPVDPNPGPENPNPGPTDPENPGTEEPSEKYGDVEVKYASVKELLERGDVEYVATSDGAELRMESAEYESPTKDQKAIKIETWTTKWDAKGQGYLIIKAPENSVFTGFWAELLFNASSRSQIFFSEDGKEWGDPISKSNYSDVSEGYGLIWNQYQTVKRTYSIGSDTAYKYIKFVFSDPDKYPNGSGYYSEIGKFGYSFRRYDTYFTTLSNKTVTKTESGADVSFDLVLDMPIQESSMPVQIFAITKKGGKITGIKSISKELKFGEKQTISIENAAKSDDEELKVLVVQSQNAASLVSEPFTESLQ